jgi:pimeloyl-ACP methyl ester carboxylesterase
VTRDGVCGSRSPRVWGATLAGLRVVDLVRDGVVLAYDDAGSGYPPLVFVHGAACNRRCWDQHVPRFSSAHRVVAVDLRGHGESEVPSERYTVGLFAEDLASTCTQLGIESPVVIGHSLGGLVALDFASDYPDHVAAAVLIDSPLLPGGDRAEVVHDLVVGLRGRDPDSALRAYFASLFGPYDNAATRSWILDQAVLTEPHVTSSIWEESLVSWDDEAALRECRVPLLYIDAGTPNADLARAVELCPGLMIARTIGSGHFSPLVVPEQVNAVLERFLRLAFSG